MTNEFAELNLSLGDALKRRVTDVEDLAKSYESRMEELNFKRYLETKRKDNERKVRRIRLKTSGKLNINFRF